MSIIAVRFCNGELHSQTLNLLSMRLPVRGQKNSTLRKRCSELLI
jgi:hypothetical protein